MEEYSYLTTFPSLCKKEKNAGWLEEMAAAKVRFLKSSKEKSLVIAGLFFIQSDIPLVF